MNLYSPSFQQFPTPGHGSVGAACAAFAQVWSCAICLGGAEAGASVRQLPCGHCFHGDCIKAGLPVGQGVWGRFGVARCPGRLDAKREPTEIYSVAG